MSLIRQELVQARQRIAEYSLDHLRLFLWDRSIDIAQPLEMVTKRVLRASFFYVVWQIQVVVCLLGDLLCQLGNFGGYLSSSESRNEERVGFLGLLEVLDKGLLALMASFRV